MWHLIQVVMIVGYLATAPVKCISKLEYKGNNVQDLEQILKAVQNGQASIMGPFSSKQFSELAKRSSPITQNDGDLPLASPLRVSGDSLNTDHDNVTMSEAGPFNTSTNEAKFKIDSNFTEKGVKNVSILPNLDLVRGGKRMQADPRDVTHTVIANKTITSTAVKEEEKLVEPAKTVIVEQEKKNTQVEDSVPKIEEKDAAVKAEVESSQKSQPLPKNPEDLKIKKADSAPEPLIKAVPEIKDLSASGEKELDVPKKVAPVIEKIESKKILQSAPQMNDDAKDVVAKDLKTAVPKSDVVAEIASAKVEKSEKLAQPSLPQEPIAIKDGIKTDSTDSVFVVHAAQEKEPKSESGKTESSEAKPNAEVKKSQVTLPELKPDSTQLFAVNFKDQSKKEVASVERIGEDNSREKRQKAEETSHQGAQESAKGEANPGSKTISSGAIPEAVKPEIKRERAELVKSRAKVEQAPQESRNPRLLTVFAHNRQPQNSAQLPNERSGIRNANSMTLRRFPTNQGLANQMSDVGFQNGPNFYQLSGGRNVLRNNYAEGSSFYQNQPAPSYRQAQAGRALTFDGNKIIDVQVVCNLPNNQMIFTVQFQRQFFGVIYAKGYFKVEACRTIGKGSQSVSLVLPLDGCGSTTVSDSWDLTNGITSFQNKIIVMFDNDLGIMSAWDSAYKASCAMGGENGPKISSHITVPMVDSSKVAPTTMNMPPAFMKIVAGKVPTAPRASLLRLGEIGTVVITIQDNVGIFDLTILNCVAHDGMNQGKIQLLNDKGCPVHNKIIGPQTRETFGKDMLIYAHFKVFKFPDVENVYFECSIKFCFHRCQQPQCGIYGVYSGSTAGRRKRRSEMDESTMLDNETPNFINDKNSTLNLFQTIKVEIPETSQDTRETVAEAEATQELRDDSLVDAVSASVNQITTSAISQNFCLTKMAFGISISMVASLFFGIACLLAYFYLQKMHEIKKCNNGDNSCFVPYINECSSSSFPPSPLSHKSCDKHRNSSGVKYDDIKRSLNTLFQLNPISPSNVKSSA